VLVAAERIAGPFVLGALVVYAFFVQGPMSCICEQCVAVCVEILEERGGPAGSTRGLQRAMPLKRHHSWLECSTTGCSGHCLSVAARCYTLTMNSTMDHLLCFAASAAAGP